MIDFTVENGATKIIPFSQRSCAAIPTLDEEPEWMKECTVCVPAGTAVLRDIRT